MDTQSTIASLAVTGPAVDPRERILEPWASTSTTGTPRAKFSPMPLPQGPLLGSVGRVTSCPVPSSLSTSCPGVQGLPVVGREKPQGVSSEDTPRDTGPTLFL